MKFHFFIFILLIFFKPANACQCPLTELNQNELNKYDIIFKGKINFLKMNGKKSEVFFSVHELYKGMIGENFKIYFNKEDACKLKLRNGDEWIIYTNYYQIDNAKLDFCSRSRFYIKNLKEDFFAVNTGMSYDEEIKYLREKLGLHKLLKNSYKVENRNVIPNKKQFVIILLCSLLGVIFFIWVVGKALKN